MYLVICFWKDDSRSWDRLYKDFNSALEDARLASSMQNTAEIRVYSIDLEKEKLTLLGKGPFYPKGE